MYLSLNWLRDFVDIPKEVSALELGKKLTMHTVEVEKVEAQADKYKNIIVGKILEVKSHPNADRLRLALVDIGKEKLEIVCGASNIKPDQLVPVALVGAVLPNGLEIKPAEIRGVKSNGMLCAEDELGLGSDHNGIMILNNPPNPLYQGGAKAKVGQNFSDYLNLNDVVFEVDNKSITHRADLWSHYGMARDISAFLNSKFKTYQPKAGTLKAKKTTFKFDVKIENFSLCPRYMGIGVEGIKIAPSPKWMQDRLAAAGMRPINNIVDVTNYVMLELGQPLHAFDKNFIDKIIVRTAKTGEIIETLDGVKRKLESDMLVIANQTKPVAVAGVMGGANSEINDQTDSIIIEAANFNFNSVRKTAQKLGLRTEASMRFEKGLDPNLCELGLARAVELILQICPGASVATNLVDEKQTPFPPERLTPFSRAGIPLLKGDGKGLKPIELDLNWLNKFIGYEFTNKQVKQILEKLGFIIKASGNNFKVTVPSWRAVHDISLPEDLAEEVVRIYGYNNLKAELPKIDLIPPLMIEEKLLIRKIKNILSLGAGFTETYNYSFLSRQQAEKIAPLQRGGAGGFDSVIRLANPLSEDLVILRPSLISGILENIRTNQAQEAEIAIYEIGGVFLNKEGEIKKDDSGKEKLPFQEKRLAIALASLPAQSGNETEDLFRKLKGVIEFLLKFLNLEVTFEQETVISNPSLVDEKSLKGGDREYKGFLPAVEMTKTTAAIIVNDKSIGFAAELEKSIKQSFGIKKSAVIAEISLPELLNLVKNSPVKQFKEPSKYPLVSRDLAFVVNKKILYNNIKKQIINFNDLIKEVELFDVYQGDKLGEDKKSLAFHIIYQADKTLTSEEVDEVQEKLIKHLEKEFEAKIRDF